MNSTELLGIARFKIHPGKLDDFKKLSAQCMEIVRTKDVGTLQYDIFINDAGTECMVIERYKDTRSLIEHSQNIGSELSTAVLATGEVFGELLGNISPDFKENLKGGPVQCFAPYLSL